MKHLRSVFFLLFLFAMAAKAENDAPAITKSNHSLTLNLFGLNYNCEYAFAPKATVLFSAGTSFGFGQLWGLDFDRDNGLQLTTKNYKILSGALAVEPRYYYNLAKRSRKGKRTFCNSGAYISGEFSYAFPIAITNNVRAAHVFAITPYWGFRRVWNHFLFDLAGGVSCLMSTNGSNVIWPSLRIGLGYKF